MHISIALPQMAPGLDRHRIRQWCERVDAGPFRSISAGERITFHNLDGFTLCNAAACWTERVAILVNLVVVPWHRPAMLAKELASLQVLSDHRLEVAVGVGGRTSDYQALGIDHSKRLARLEAGVSEIRSLWAGTPAADGVPVGPTIAAPLIYASPMGPKSWRNAAQWADGVSGFDLTPSAESFATAIETAQRSWEEAGRQRRPWCITGTFVSLGADAAATMTEFAYAYLQVFSPTFARSIAQQLPATSAERLAEILAEAHHAGFDEFIVVPATSDPLFLDELEAVIAHLDIGSTTVH